MTDFATGRTILLVDDEPQILAGMKHTLRRQDWNVLTAHSGMEALATAWTHDVDVVVADERMPGMTGTEMFEVLKQHRSRALRILLTGHPSLPLALKAINACEVHRFLVKPIDAGSLLLALREAIVEQDLASQDTEVLDGMSLGFA